MATELHYFLTGWGAGTAIGVTALPIAKLVEMSFLQTDPHGLLSGPFRMQLKSLQTLDVNFAMWAHFRFWVPDEIMTNDDSAVIMDYKIQFICHSKTGKHIRIPNGISFAVREVGYLPHLFPISRWGCSLLASLKGPNGVCMDIGKMMTEAERADMRLLPVARHTITNLAM